MIFQKLKQYALNNFWHGEQQRRRVYVPARVVTTLVRPDYARVWGLDTSHYDRNVNLSVSKQRGASFVFIKAIDGTIQNSYFVPNRQRAKDAGLLHAPYGWLYRDVNVSCVAQARAYSDILKAYPSDLPPVMDFEWTSWAGSPSNPTYADLDKWVTEWLRLGNRKPILYSAAGYMNPFGQIPAALKAKFAGIWIANYGVNNPMMPTGYAANEWLFHQFTSSGDAVYLAPNDSGKLELDLNYFNGTIEQLYALAGQVVTPPPPPDGGNMRYTATAIYDGTRLRPFSNVNSTYIGSYPAGTKFNGDVLFEAPDNSVPNQQAGDKWLEVKDINGTAKSGWVAVTHLGKPVCTLIDNGAPPPPPPADSVFVTVDVEVNINGKLYGATALNLEALPK